MSFKVSHVARGVHTVSFVVSTILGTQWFEAKRTKDGFGIEGWCVEFDDEEKLAFLFNTKRRSAWPKDNIAAEVAKCMKVSVCADTVCADTVCGVYTVDMFEGHGAVVVGGDDFYASLSTLPDGAVIGAALSKDLFEKIAEEYGIAR